MSSLQEIMRAIGTLSPADRARLVKDLPTLLPELDGDAAWERIIQDPAPSSKLSALVDGVDAEYGKNPNAFPEIKENDFDRNM